MIDVTNGFFFHETNDVIGFWFWKFFLTNVLLSSTKHQPPAYNLLTYNISKKLNNSTCDSNSLISSITSKYDLLCYRFKYSKTFLLKGETYKTEFIIHAL